MSQRTLEESFKVVDRQLEKRLGRMLTEGEIVQEGDLLCCMPDDLWIPAPTVGLKLSPCDVGWYRRPQKGAQR